MLDNNQIVIISRKDDLDYEILESHFENVDSLAGVTKMISVYVKNDVKISAVHKDSVLMNEIDWDHDFYIFDEEKIEELDEIINFMDKIQSDYKNRKLYLAIHETVKDKWIKFKKKIQAISPMSLKIYFGIHI